MSTIPEQISAAAQTQLATQLAVIHTLSNTAFGGIQKLIALNFNMIQQSVDSSLVASQQLMAVTGPQDLLAVSSAQTQPRIEKIMAYGRELASISNEARSSFLQVVGSVSNTAPTISAPKEGKTLSENKAAPAVTATPKVSKVLPTVAKPAGKTTLKAATSAADKSVAKPAAKPALSSNTQLPLLTDSSAKPAAAKTAAIKNTKATPAQSKTIATTPLVATAPAPKVSKPKAKPAAATVTAVAPAIPVPAAANIPTAVKAEVATQAELAPKAAIDNAKPAEPTNIDATTAVVAATPVSKPAISGLPSKAAAKPGFPAVGGRPAFKEKSSKATGAKMRVRQ